MKSADNYYFIRYCSQWILKGLLPDEQENALCRLWSILRKMLAYTVDYDGIRALKEDLDCSGAGGS
jgi:hypothetical protein